MYAQATIQGLQVPLINPMQYQQNFMFDAGTPDQELNSKTPQVALAAANLIIQSLAQQHPVRVNAYNSLGQNGFLNQEFRNFIVGVMRISLAMFETRQITSIQQIISAKLPEWVQMVSAVMAQRNPQLMSMMDQNSAMQLQQMANNWMGTLQQAEQVIAQVMQQQMANNMGNNGQWNNQQNPQLNNFGTNFAGGNSSGAFVAGHGAGSVGGASGVVADAPVNRFQKKLQEEQQVVRDRLAAAHPAEKGTSIMEQPVQVQQVPVAPAIALVAGLSHAERLRRELAASAALVEGEMPSGATATGAQSIIDKQASFATDVAQFGSHTVTAETPVHRSTVYERATMDAAPAATTVTAKLPENPVDLVEPKKTILRELLINDHTLRMVSLLQDIGWKEAGWKPSKFQSHFPAWCRRTHEMMYAVDIDGDVVAIAIDLNEEDMEKMFDYETHGIDPTKGKPDAPISVKPTEEAKILYSNEKDPKINMVIKAEYVAATSQDDLVQQVMADAVVAFEESRTNTFYAATGISHTIQASGTEEKNLSNYNQVREVFLQVSLADAAQKIKEISTPLLRRRINAMFTKALDNALQLSLGLDAGVTSFEDEAGTIIEDVREAFGDIYSDALSTLQWSLICKVVDANLPEEADGHHSNMIDGKKETIAKINKTSFYLVEQMSVMVTRFTEDELALGLAPAGASQLAQDAYPALYAAIRKYFESEIGKNERVRTLLLSSIDGAQWEISSNPLNPAYYLIKAVG